jgi:cyclopropane fatty-acyl-phospholipid synthase-like methyltransferase
LDPGSAVLELGCGCGRIALALLGYLEPRGRYVGQDVDLQMIEWCRRHIRAENFRFEHADLFSKVYNPAGKPVAGYRFPAEEGSTSLIISVSVFSHLLYDDFRHYVGESGRVLSRGGKLHMTLFALDFMKERLGDRWTFAHEMGRCRVESRRYPEAAVAYELATVRELLSEAGLSIADIYNQDLHQQTIIAMKG